MSIRRWVLPSATAFLVGGCGLYVPEIQENPYSAADGQLLVQAIVQSVHCEVVNSLQWVVNEERKFAKEYHQKPVTDFLNKWGVQISLTLTIEEKSALSPNLVWLPHSPASAIFTLGAGGTLSSDATRTDKLSFYYTVPELLKRLPCATGVQQGSERSLLIQSDLKLREWLEDYLTPVATQVGQAPTSPKGILKTNVLSHAVKFEVLSSGNITPAWKLSRVNVNQSGSFFSTSRDRTHDLIITMGPGDETGLTGQAAISADASLQIGNAVKTNLKGIFSP